MQLNATLVQRKCNRVNRILLDDLHDDYSDICGEASLLLSDGFSVVPFLELDAGDGSLLSVDLKSKLRRSRIILSCSYINSLLEGLPRGSGRYGGVVDVGQTGSSPESHDHQGLIGLLCKIFTLWIGNLTALNKYNFV